MEKESSICNAGFVFWHLERVRAKDAKLSKFSEPFNLGGPGVLGARHSPLHSEKKKWVRQHR